MNRSTVPALAYLSALTFRRQLVSKKTAGAAIFLALLAVLVLAVGVFTPWNPRRFSEQVVLQLFGGFFLPLLALSYGTGALGDERDEKSLIHLLSRALPRSGIYLAKALAAVPLALTFALGGLWLLSRLGGLGGLESAGAPGDVFAVFSAPVLWATLAYLALFQLFAAAFRHSTAIAVAYVFFVEIVVGSMPGVLKRISLQFYFNCLARQRGEALGVLRLPPEDARFYLPIDGDAARAVLWGLTLGLLLTGAVLFARREYPDGG